MTENEKARLPGEEPRLSEAATALPTVNVAIEKSDSPKAALHPAAYVVTWISLSGGVILFNKWLLSTMGFHFRMQGREGIDVVVCRSRRCTCACPTRECCGK